MAKMATVPASTPAPIVINILAKDSFISYLYQTPPENTRGERRTEMQLCKDKTKIAKIPLDRKAFEGLC